MLLTIGRWAQELRLIPFPETCASGLDKVRGALSSSAQWELEALMQGLSFTGVPALPVAKAVREALEHAWFEQRPLTIRYTGAGGTTIRTIRVESMVFERSLTLINARDLEKDAPRQFRLDRIECVDASGG